MTGSRRLALALALVLAAGAAAVAGVVLTRGDGVPDESVARRLQARATLEPRVVLFGDTVRAQVDVTFDRRRVDAGSVKVRAGFKEWQPADRPDVVRRDAGQTTHLRVTYTLRCLRSNCPPERDSRPFSFEPATVSFLDLDGDEPVQASVDATWPKLVVNTRLDPGDPANPWRFDVNAVPEPTYRAAPGLLLGLLGGGGALLALLAGALAWLGRPRREPAPVFVPPALPEFHLTPLEQALELLEQADANGAADQRRSLELVAEVLAQRGDADGLAPAARELAWSPTPPPLDATRRLAVRVRAQLDEELRRLEAERRRLEAEAAAVAAAAEEEARARRS